MAHESILNPNGNKTLAEIRTSAVSYLSSYFWSYVRIRDREEAALSEEVKDRLADLAEDNLIKMKRIFADFYEQQDIILSKQSEPEQ